MIKRIGIILGGGILFGNCAFRMVGPQSPDSNCVAWEKLKKQTLLGRPRGVLISPFFCIENGAIPLLFKSSRALNIL